MILLQSDCLVFKTAAGESIPCSAETVTVELMGESAADLDPELIHNASAAVLHYFKTELHRISVSVSEFSEVLAQVLKNFGYEVAYDDGDNESLVVEVTADLRRLAVESGKGFELTFFTDLRNLIRAKLEENPEQLRFVGLKGCVKQLLGARRWSVRCQRFHDQIVGYLRHCYQNYAGEKCGALIIS